MENQEQKLTVKDVLQGVHRNLGALKVPVGEIDSIGLPIARALADIRACLDAIEREEAKRQEEPEIEFVLAEDEAPEAEGETDA